MRKGQPVEGRLPVAAANGLSPVMRGGVCSAALRCHCYESVNCGYDEVAAEAGHLCGGPSSPGREQWPCCGPSSNSPVLCHITLRTAALASLNSLVLGVAP